MGLPASRLRRRGRAGVRELALPDDFFAAHVVQCVPVNRTPELRAALRDVAALPRLGARLQRAVDAILDQHERHSSEGGWPGLFADLAHSDSPGATPED